MTLHPLVSREEWLDARMRLLEREKEMTHMRDRPAEERRSLPRPVGCAPQIGR